ncbi:MAG: hypothetical protein ACRCWG_01055 [Sarcina sp.]
MGWISRGGIVSLSLDPTKDVRTKSASRDSVWNFLVDPENNFISDPY